MVNWLRLVCLSLAHSTSLRSYMGTESGIKDNLDAGVERVTDTIVSETVQADW